MKNKLYLIKKYVMAKSAEEALKKEPKIKPDDVWVDEEWKKLQEEKPTRMESAIGFDVSNKE